jgi:hypothetical protein
MAEFFKNHKNDYKNPEYRRYSVVTVALTAAIIFLQKIQICNYLYFYEAYAPPRFTRTV